MKRNEKQHKESGKDRNINLISSSKCNLQWTYIYIHTQIYQNQNIYLYINKC